mgnify:CR=1 FL=1
MSHTCGNTGNRQELPCINCDCESSARPADAEMEHDSRVMQRATLAELNKREPKPAMILRLLTEAQVGKAVDVSVADALEFRRDQYRLTQGEFAAILGLHPGHYSEIINGKRRLPIGAMKRAFAIGVPAEVLLQPDA